MSIQHFTFYMHDTNNSMERRENMECEGVSLSEEAWENVGEPFYKVALQCAVDEDGKVTIIGII